MGLFQAISHDIVIKCFNQTDENHSPDMVFFHNGVFLWTIAGNENTDVYLKCFKTSSALACEKHRS